MSHRHFKNFIDEEESAKIVDWASGLDFSIGRPNHHLAKLSKSLNGGSVMFDISKTSITKYITEFQSISSVVQSEVPQFIYSIREKISSQLNIPVDNSFLQVVDMSTGGEVQKHYDAAVEGHINYKCNISVLAEPYDFCIDSDTLTIDQSDMYCFEASLYKHWTPAPFRSRRILLSFGFMLPYAVLSRDPEDPRVRLSNRIAKHFQK
jgi:hypothetical protein